LVEVYSSAHETALLRQTYERYLTVFPGKLNVQAALADMNRAAKANSVSGPRMNSH
jgi:hypothetical protein